MGDDVARPCERTLQFLHIFEQIRRNRGSRPGGREAWKSPGYTQVPQECIYIGHNVPSFDECTL